MDSDTVGFNRDVQGLCSIDLRLRDVLGPRCIELMPQNKRLGMRYLGCPEASR